MFLLNDLLNCCKVHWLRDNVPYKNVIFIIIIIIIIIIMNLVTKIAYNY